MTNGDESIGGHDKQENRRRELRDGGADHVQLAQKRPENPLVQVHCGKQERYPDEKADICHGQVQYVAVRDGLHLGETQDDVNHERVAKCPDDANQQIKDYRDNVAHRVLNRRTRHILHRLVRRRKVVVRVEWLKDVLVEEIYGASIVVRLRLK